MNKKRRAKILNVIEQLTIELTRLEQIRDTVQDILDEETEAFDNMPEGLQESYNGQISQEAQESMESAIDSLDEAISSLEEVL